MGKSLRILLVDDHVLFRKGLVTLLEAQDNLQVVGEADNGLEGVEQARELLPDIILMDVNMPECDGIEATRRIKQEMPHMHIVMLTVSEEDEDLFQAIKNGAQGYLLKNLEPQELFDRLAGIYEGESPISGVMATKILDEFKHPQQSAIDEVKPVDALTPREIEVLEQVVLGKTNKDIATALNITENTVKIHLRNILEKLHVQNRIQAAVHAITEGLVKEPPVSAIADNR
jgi:DNA-binding NarL/FixJ family response regulator